MKPSPGVFPFVAEESGTSRYEEGGLGIGGGGVESVAVVVFACLSVILPIFGQPGVRRERPTGIRRAYSHMP